MHPFILFTFYAATLVIVMLWGVNISLMSALDYNFGNLFRAADDKHQLARCPLFRQGIKGHGKSLAEQLGQQPGKILAFRNDFNLRFRKAVGKQQNAKALRQYTAMAVGQTAANFRPGGRRKGNGHKHTTFFQLTVNS